MGEQELRWLHWAVERLTEAQREALDVCDAALGPPQEGGSDEDVRLAEESEDLRAALEEVRAILDDAADDVRGAGRTDGR